MEQALGSLRRGDWLTRERIRLVAWILLIASAVSLLYLVVTATNGVDLQGRPLGTDFSDIYAAGTYVLDGKPDAPFNPPAQYARERLIFGDATPFYGWHYPPYFLFVAGALALLPYGTALLVWQTLTLGLYLLVIRAILGSFRGPLRWSPESITTEPRGLAHNQDLWRSWLWIPDSRCTASGMTRDWLLLALAFPAVLINAGHGQNGFLTAALIGGALVVLDRRPVTAGILFGLLVYKPQFGLMIPVVLAASGRWRCFAAAAATVVVLTLATTFAFGVEIWRAFADSTEFTRTVALEQGNTGWHKIQTVFSWARMWGAPIPLAYALQGATTAALAVALVWLWRGPAPYASKAAALCLATILATPYSFDYDMVVLAPAIAFVAAEGFARSFVTWEKTALAALWLVPLFARSVAQFSLIPIGVPAMLSVFILVLRQSSHNEHAPSGASAVTIAARPPV
jgi:alpha-1,2-mannosyltransferase